MSLPTPEEIMLTYLYGSAEKPLNLIDPAQIRSTNPIVTIDIDASEYMANGGGRFAKLSQALVVQNFFGAASDSNEAFQATGVRKEFTLSEMQSLVDHNLVVLSDDRIAEYIGYQQYNYGPSSADYTERVNYWNTSGFVIRGEEITFVVDEVGNRFIENTRVLPLNEDFDYTSSNYVALITGPISQANTDPSEIGRTVELNYHNTIESVPFVSSYSYSDYLVDQIYVAGQWTLDTSLFTAGIYDHFQELFDDGTTRFTISSEEAASYSEYANLAGDVIFYWPNDNTSSFTALSLYHQTAIDENGLVVVGSNQGNLMNFFEGTVLANVPEITVFGFGGNDTINGTSKRDILVGGTGDDNLYGHGGNDRFFGGTGADVIDGGEGIDVLDFSGRRRAEVRMGSLTALI